jgi:hypothetical protein
VHVGGSLCPGVDPKHHPIHPRLLERYTLTFP